MGVMQVLVKHFFRRFFDNDTIQADGDTETTVVRAIVCLAAPGLLISFFIAALAPARLPLWVGIPFHYFFVLFSFLVMGGVAVFEWEMLFPDRMDFLILSPLSLKPQQMLAAKMAALAVFFALFLVGTNAFSTLIVPVTSHGAYFRQLMAHALAVSMAGVFAALCFLAVGSVLLCVLDGPRFRVASPVVQTLLTMTLVMLMIHFVSYGGSIYAMLTGPRMTARWFPPLWFLGLYEELLLGREAPAFAGVMTKYALRGTAAVALVVLVTYPMAWARMRRMAIEGTQAQRTMRWGWVSAMVHRVVKKPGERAVFHFIGQTLTRNSKYQVYLAMYCGVGLALAAAFGASVEMRGGSARLVMSAAGMNAVVPLLVFWIVVGLRTAFAFPVNLQAGWVFRVTGVKMGDCASAARKWVLLCVACVTACVLASLLAIGWGWRRVLVQVVCGAALGVLMNDGLFFFQESVPFNRPRMPGRTSLPIVLTMYLGVFPLLMTWMMGLALRLERDLRLLGWVALMAAVGHVLFLALRRWLGDFEEEVEGYDGEYVLLGLS